MTAAILSAHAPAICQMLRMSEVRTVREVPPGSVTFVVQGVIFAMPLADVIDLKAEHARLSRQVEQLSAAIDQNRLRLADPAFIAKAPEDVVSETRQRLADAQATRMRLQGILSAMNGA
jgi:valyl-tRNA synthetase